MKFLDGTEVPWLAFGSYDHSEFEENAGPLAIECGFKHLDTAQLYGNGIVEEQVGRVMAKCDQDGKVYLTTKISRINRDADPLPIDQIHKSIEASHAKLGRPADLWLIHSPTSVGDGSGDPHAIKAAWKVLEDLKTKGVVRSIGVSNFQPCDLNAILEDCRYKPVCNQIEFHPYVLEHLQEVLEIHQRHGILTAAFGPLTPIARSVSGPLDGILQKIANRWSEQDGLQADKATVLLKWIKSQNAIAICMSANSDRIRSLARTDDFPDLTKEEADEISKIGSQSYYRYYDTLMVKRFPVPAHIQAKAMKGPSFALKV